MSDLINIMVPPYSPDLRARSPQTHKVNAPRNGGVCEFT